MIQELNSNRFRVWDIIEKKMVTPEIAENDLTNILAVGFHGLPIAIDNDSISDKGLFKAWNRDHNLILMKSTGLLDKSKRELFENDIVIFEACTCIVKFGWYIFNQYNNFYGWYLHFVQLDVDDPFDQTTAEGSEIIGNVFENTELVK